MERALRHIIGVFATSLVLLTTSGVSVAGPYAPAAGETGSTAVAHDDSRFVSWATGATVDYSGALALPDEQWRDASMVLGPAKSILDGAYFDIVSLGRGGEIILDFETPIVDGDGADFAIFENSFSDTFLELAYVEVSDGSLALDGSGEQIFLRFDNFSLTDSAVNAFGTLDPTDIHGLAGKYRSEFGTPFDLSDLTDQISDIQNYIPSFSFDLNNITQIKIVDVVGDGTNYDTLGNPIYDPYATTGSTGFDLEAVGVINQLGGPPPPVATSKQVPIPFGFQLSLLGVLVILATPSLKPKQ